MIQTERPASPNGLIILFFLLINVIAIKDGYIGDEEWHIVLFLSIPLLVLAIAGIVARRKIKMAKYLEEDGSRQSTEKNKLPE